MASFNRTILLGKLTRDPELRYTPSGTAVTEIGMAVNEKEKKGNEYVDVCLFVDVTLWGRTAEVVTEYCRKGSDLFIEGKLKLDTWEDKNGGGKRSKLRVVGERIQLLGSKGGGQGGSQGGGRRQQNEPSGDGGGDYSQSGPDEDAGIPF